MAKCYNNLGLLYWKQESFDEANEFTLKSLEYNEKLDNKTEIAWCLNNLGGINFAQNNYTEALQYYQKSLDVARLIDNKRIIFNALKNIGVIFMEQNNYEQALKYFQEALTNSIETGDKYHVCVSYINFGNVYYKMGNFDVALEYTSTSLHLAKELNFLDLYKTIHKQLSDIYAAINDYQKAYEHHLLFKSYSDSIFNENNLREIIVLEYQYQYDKQRQKIELEQQKETQKQKFLRNTFFIGFIVVALFFALLLRSFILNKKANIKLAQRQKEIEEKNVELYQQKEEIAEQAEELSVINQELEKLSIVASETDNAIFIMDKFGNFEWFNEACKKLYGFEYNEFVEKYPDILSLIDDDENRKQISEIFKNKNTVIFENVVEAKNKEKIWVQTTLTPILDYQKNIKKIIAVNSNISKLIAYEKELKNINDYITGSIRYAKTIQSAMLPPPEKINPHFENFVVFRPKDIVSGDFYWFEQVGKYFFVAVADCTGHGVAGAFMSMIGTTLLNQLVYDHNCLDTVQILTKLNEHIVVSLNQENKMINQGMDISLCRIEIVENKALMQFTGAKRPLLCYRSKTNKIEKINGDKKSIGGAIKYHYAKEFTSNCFELDKDDIIYMFSDGLIDQNNTDRRKFGTSKLIGILENISKNSLDLQQKILTETLDNWVHGTIVRDDITMLGLKL